MRVKIFIFILIIGVICVPAYFIMSSFGLFQNEKVLVQYKVAVDLEGEKYDAWPVISSFTAIDKKRRRPSALLSGGRRRLRILVSVSLWTI